jgi:SAM-dependent methyltransferase
LQQHLVCPRDQQNLRIEQERVVCSQGHEYPVVNGVPVMLWDDSSGSIGAASLREARKQALPDPWFVDSIPCNAGEYELIRQQIAAFQPGAVDPVVQAVLTITNGNLYRPLLGRLREYPIPELRLPDTTGDTFLDIGCNWGRWCVAASRKGYRAVGIDPGLGAVLAAKRVCQQLAVTAAFVVGDARCLPFAADSFDRVFSYSVLQHFSKEDTHRALAEVARVLWPGGESLIQMPNSRGVRSLERQMMRGFRTPRDYEVRYWTPGELLGCFRRIIGESRLSADCYFGLGIQMSDLKLMPAMYRAVIRASEMLRRMSEKVPALVGVADSLYVHSRRA